MTSPDLKGNTLVYRDRFFIWVLCMTLEVISSSASTARTLDTPDCLVLNLGLTRREVDSPLATILFVITNENTETLL